MHFDDQQTIDPAPEENPFDFEPWSQGDSEKRNASPDQVGNCIPGGQPEADRVRQTAQMTPESLQQQALGGQGDMLGDQETYANADPSHPGDDKPAEEYRDDRDHDDGSIGDPVWR